MVGLGIVEEKASLPALLACYHLRLMHKCYCRLQLRNLVRHLARDNIMQAILWLQEADAEQLRQQMADAKKAGDLQTAPVWAGTGVGLIKSIEPADKLVSRMAAELADVLRHTSGMVHANGGP